MTDQKRSKEWMIVPAVKTNPDRISGAFVYKCPTIKGKGGIAPLSLNIWVNAVTRLPPSLARPASARDSVLGGSGTGDTVLCSSGTCDTVLLGASARDSVLFGSRTGNSILRSSGASNAVSLCPTTR
jgi:hypothetical protein